MSAAADPCSAFGDLEHGWSCHRVRRGGDWIELTEDASDLLFALLRQDGFAASGERLWRAAHGSVRAFDGGALMAAITDLNTALAALDIEVVVEAFTARLVDVTPRILPLKGRGA